MRVRSRVVLVLSCCLAACGTAVQSGSPADSGGSNEVGPTDAVVPDASIPSVADATADTPVTDARSDAAVEATSPDGSVDTGPTDPLTVEFASDCAFTACGGTPTGAWRYASICTADPFASVRTSCPGLTTTVTGTTRGSLSMNGSHLTRDISAHLEIRGVVPPACAIIGCAAVQAIVVNTGWPDAQCTANTGSGCDCHMTRDQRLQDDAPCAISGSQVLVGLARYDFCASGGTLRYRESGAFPREPWVATLVAR